MLQMYRLLREFYQHVLRPLFRIIFWWYHEKSCKLETSLQLFCIWKPRVRRVVQPVEKVYIAL